MTRRDPWLDNAKLLLVVLVVIGHGWTLLPSDGVAARPYDFLYAWHIPAFVFVTGYLSRGFDYSRRRIWQLVRTVLVPYVVFEAAMAVFRVHVGGERLEDLWLDPHWPMWFLAALFCWRLATPLLRALPGWVAVAVAIGLSLAAGMWAGDTLDLARVLGLLPFFVLGLTATPERLEHLRGPAPTVLAIGVLAAIWVAAAHTDAWGSTEWFYYRAPYDELAISDQRAAITRLVLIGVGAAGTLAFLALIPRRSQWFSAMGSATLVVYLFHGFFVKGLEYAGLPDWSLDHPWIGFAVLTAGWALLALVLASPPVAARLERVVDPFGAAERTVDEAIALTAAAEPTGSGSPSPATR